MMERNGVNQVELGAATGIAVSRINNYLHGKYRTIRPDHLERMVKAATRTAGEGTELIRSYLLDMLPEVFQREIRIEAVGSRGKSDRTVRPEKSLLPSTTTTAIQALEAMSLKNARARARVECISEILAEIHLA
jgi:transcriptional regulator with XRE-family HTH domain